MTRKKTTAAILAAALGAGALALPALSHGWNEGTQTPGGWPQQGVQGQQGMMGGGMMGGGMMGGRNAGAGMPGGGMMGAQAAPGGGMMGAQGAQPGMGGGMMGGRMMQMMQMMRQHMMGGGMGPGAAMGPMGGKGIAGMLARGADANDDGTVSPDELKAALTAKLTEYDADGDGTLSLSEFEALHSALIRERMVDRFQALDDDGDGKVTAAEITAPARRMEKMMKLRARAQQGATAPATAPGKQQQPGMMDGSMMKEPEKKQPDQN